MEQFFLANLTPEERQVPLLITCISEHTYKDLNDLCDLIRPADHSYAKLCSIISDQFAPKVSVFHKRQEFYSLRKTAQVSVNKWYVKIKNAALFCNFKKNLNDILRDKFLTGLRDCLIKDRLCEDKTDARLNNLVELTIKRESFVKASSSNAKVYMKAVNEYEKTRENQ